MQLNPRENFTVVRQIEDHTDNATYYVRAVIRNAKTDAVITTLDLEDKGSRRFTKNWLVPVDASGQGFYVSILTTVYTDSGYTTKSENYGEKVDIYLVQDRGINTHGGGGGADVDYKKIKTIVDDSVEGKITKIVEKQVKISEVKGVVQEVSKNLSKHASEIISEIKAIEKPEKVSFDGVLGELNNVRTLIGEAIEAIRDGQNLGHDNLSQIASELTAAAQNIAQASNEAVAAVSKDLSTGLDKIKTGVENLKVVVDLGVKAEGKVAPIEKEHKADDRVKRILRKL